MPFPVAPLIYLGNLTDVFSDVVSNGVEPHTTHESLLDARGDLLVISTTPDDNGRRKHQQVTR